MLRTLAVILLLPGCARLAVSLNRAEEKGSKTALARAQAQLIRRVLRGETHYDVLDLPANSTTDEIKAARDDLARSIHPDKLEGSPQGADAATTKVNLAYETLSDASARGTYDALLSEPFARDEATMIELGGKFGDALADALAFAEDDEQAEGLARVLEDCIDGESEDVTIS